MNDKSEVGRPKGPDARKIAVILKVLQQYPEGVWLRKLSAETKLPVATVSYYLGILDNFVESSGIKAESGRFIGFRLIKFKPGKENTVLADVLKYLEVKKRIKGSI